jgi:PIN domain nuclease of toxin-antitoxin system
VKYLLDTHAWIWAVLAQSSLSRRARTVLAGLGAEDRIGIASISLKEASWQLAQERIVITSATWEEWLREAAAAPQLDVLPLTVEIAIASEKFSRGFPRDPADRLIAATANVHGLTLVTRDRALLQSQEVRTLW